MTQITGADEDTRLLWRLGHYIYKNGCRRDLDLAVTDMYLRGKMNDGDCETLRENIIGLYDEIEIEKGLAAPRLEKINNLILKINGIIN